MSLIQCHECKTEVSSKATSCPKCGAPVKRSSSGIGCLVIIILSVAIIYGLYTQETENASKPHKTMMIEVASGNHEITIKNTGSPDIAACAITVYLNGTPPFTYAATFTAPSVGESVSIPLSSFINKDGKRFNPISYAVTEAWVGGSGYDYAKFK
ncbi:MAG: hypothetical protein PHI84_08525 [Kiritimatiellae bacterium]|nr:hypothetical protein [Kiritimatiellia bacterium]